jgi:tryptophanyl-tRNA synthetase
MKKEINFYLLINMEPNPVIFSGIQPSGNIHLGNYLGALKNWTTLQENYCSYFCIVDLHAITVPQDPKELRKKVVEIAKIYLAAGINPKKATIFAQSQVSEHAELMWLLNTLVQTTELQRMTQFKDKSEKSENVSAGLFTYPVLMAADILLYNTDLVPVGEDQTQHIELARDLAKRFNHRFGETFKIPKAYIKKEGMRIMGLDDPIKKMSKSSPSKYNRIDLLDSPDEIHDKIKKAVTDSGNTIEYSDERPAIKNLLNIFSLTSDKSIEELVANFEKKGFKEFKEELAESVVNFLVPFQERYANISDRDVEEILAEGKLRAKEVAAKTLGDAKEKMGL